MAYNALGSTGPIATRATIKNLRAALDQHKNVLAADQARVTNAFNAARNIASEIGNAKSYEQYCQTIHKYLIKH